MNFQELKKFLDSAIEQNFKLPDNLAVVISDFSEAIPEEHQHVKDLEYNHRYSKDKNQAIKVIVKPDVQN